MMAKPIRAPELQYPMIQFLIIIYIALLYCIQKIKKLRILKEANASAADGYEHVQSMICFDMGWYTGTALTI